MTNKNSETTEKTSRYDDQRRPLIRALKISSRVLLVAMVLSLMIWGAAKGLPGIWAVLIGTAIGGGFMLLTVVSVLLTANTTPTTTGVVVLGGWLVKVIVLIIVLVALRGLSFYDNVALFVTVIVALVVTLATEVWAILTTNVTYVG